MPRWPSILLAWATFSVAHAWAVDFREVARLFEYDSKAPLDVQEKAVDTPDGVTAHDLSYASPKGGRVPGFLIVPPGKGPFPAIIFGHWGMPEWLGGNRSEFVNEAMWLARTGVACLLVEETPARPAPWRRPADPHDHAHDDEVAVQNVVDLRRGVDLLAARDDINQQRIGYVGHSLGAGFGAILRAVESRIKVFVLMAGVPSGTDLLRLGERPELIEFRKRVPKEELERYIKMMAPFDAVNFVRQPRSAPILFQFGRSDDFVPDKEAKRFYASAAEPKEVRSYNSGHELNVQALRDRDHWLAEKLGF
jgi:cephalosporin-C deacetylase-like acetyl esterase